jgi:yecA family protein
MTDTPQSKRAKTIAFNKEMQALFRPKSKKQLLDEADELVYRAWEAPSRKRAIDLARRALELSADCVDAYLMLADLEAETDEEAIALYRKAVETGRRTLGKKAFREDVGHFWGLIDTRPFMRAMDSLASSLRYTDGEPEAIEIWREMLHLNPGDNQGARYRLLALLVEMNRNEEAEVLIEEHGEDFLADWAYARALLAFRSEGDTARSRELLAAALAKNAHVPHYLLARKKLPKTREEFISPGGESEAISCSEAYILSWRLTPGAGEWLARESGVPFGRGYRPRLTPLFPATEKKNLSRLLALATVPDDVLNLESLHGFLFGLAITPDMVKPSEWLPFVFGEELLTFTDEKKSEQLLETLFNVHDRFIDEREAGRLGFPFNYDKLALEEMPRVQDWAFGLFLALGMRPGFWGLRDGQYERMLERQEGAAWAAAVVSTVGLPETLDEGAEADGYETTDEETGRIYMSMFDQLPDAVATLMEHAGKRRHLRLVPQAPLRVEKIGRNDPCPCGSGKKYKKCCGG